MDSSEFFRILQTSKVREEKGEKENRKERRRDDEYYYYCSDDAFSFSNKLMKNDIGNTDIFAFIDEGKLMNICVFYSSFLTDLSLLFSPMLLPLSYSCAPSPLLLLML